jgi:hypothetical protein
MRHATSLASFLENAVGAWVATRVQVDVVLDGSRITRIDPAALAVVVAWDLTIAQP